MNQFEFPDAATGRSLLQKLGKEEVQFELFGQDWEYILADEVLLPEYIRLYESNETTDQEKRVLGCFIIQSIENKLPDKISAEKARSHLRLLCKDRHIHQSEIEYWSVVEENDEEHMFQVTKYIREL
ncbi:hypothetical protein [uncultured Gimesia sp.]|uniref:hypothetical protein n=1 Tax=uncultured Gimesia sp. TaxID=1678688 RepID=UPI00261AE0D1|nr:hypothetical protein [uncultured Gimesia sp.]